MPLSAASGDDGNIPADDGKPNKKGVLTMTEKEIIEVFGKSIWDMTAEELVKNNLDKIWFLLVEKEDEE